MSNLPPNPFNNIAGGNQTNANVGAPVINHSQQISQVPLSQLPPGYAPGLKQDSNSNSPLHAPTSVPQNNALQNVSNYNHSGNSSPAFNQPGIMPQQSGLQSSPVRPALVNINKNPLPPIVPHSSASPQTVPNSNSSPTPYTLNYAQHQINDNVLPLVSSSQFSQPLLNGPPNGPISSPPSLMTSNPLPPPSSGYSVPPVVKTLPNPVAYNPPPMTQAFGPPPVAKPPGPGPMVSRPNVPFSAPQAGPPRNSPLLNGPTTGPASGPQFGPPISMGINGPTMPGPHMGTVSGPPFGPSTVSGPRLPSSLMAGPPGSQIIPPRSHMGGPPGVPMSGPPGLQMGGPPGPLGSQISGPNQPFPGPPRNGPSAFPPMSTPGPSVGLPSGPQSLPAQFPPMPTQPPMAHQMGPPIGPTSPPGAMKSNMQSRYPQMPATSINNQPSMPMQPNMQRPYPQQQAPQQYNTQAMTQQMGQLSVTKQGFDQLWGHHMVDLLQSRHILPEYPEDPPEIKLGHQFAEAANCSPEIFRCTLNKIPETNSLLQKSRLPLGILIHPFKDLNHLPVIQCNTIVRCRACRTYINPFVYFVDAKRWKCNLCYRVNDLPEEFQYDPVSKSYGDPSRRPEIKSATIEFIAPGEYMLRPPQPAVYLFLLDVSHLARESGYLQVICETLKESMDLLPGDARTQVGFLCFDSHVHYYLMSDGLTRPKEMTVLDIDDIFLPSPESLLVNLAERRELVRELLCVLPQRHCAPGVPGSALGAALQAAYKLMAPTGGRITVFQTCLPNTGPGALQSREDPNARSSKDVAHLNPATDFYKRLALDCSGAQVAVDLFLLNSQYSDLATLSGMSKFSGGTVYHIPLFKASRSWQAEQLHRMFSRYLTRKVGFEAVMRVRCTRGLSIHTFHGNFFVRSTDLLSLPNVSPDAGFGMQLTIDESLSDVQQVCFQAALLYTSSKGERRIRVHTMALPIASTLPDVLHNADQQCIIGLVSKMAVDRATSASMSEAREAVMNVAVDALSAHRLAQNLPAGAVSQPLHAPMSLRLLPLYLLALLKRKAFRTGTSTRLDDRVADMCALKCSPLSLLLRAVYPHLYPVHALRDHLVRSEDGEEMVTDPPRLHLTAERVNSNGAYLLDDGESMIVYIGHNVSPAFLSETFGVTAFSQIADEARSLPKLETEGSQLLHAFIERLNDDRPYISDILVLRDNSPSRQMFIERLIDDRVESAFSYYEFLQHVKSQVK